jgi:hypothetical protein
MSPTATLAASVSRQAIDLRIVKTPHDSLVVGRLVAWLVWSSSKCACNWCTKHLVKVKTMYICKHVDQLHP